jgi:hypothetical protein
MVLAIIAIHRFGKVSLMPLQRVDELTAPPVVGQFYLVPVVHGKWCKWEDDWPVMGNQHEDRKFFSFPHQHYHIDRRFIADPYRAIKSIATPLSHEGRWLPPLPPLPAPRWKRLKCRRAIEFDFPTTLGAVTEMQEELAGVQCKRDEAGWVCPHRGFRLATARANREGIVQCPLHGLLIDSNTGIVINKEGN